MNHHDGLSAHTDTDQQPVPVIRQMGDCWVLSFNPQASGDWFDPSVTRWQAALIGEAGRGSAWFMTLQGQAVVLRHYRRGGLIARISRDLYVWQGLAASRSFREFDVLAALSAQGLRVAKPVAAMVRRVGGVFYRAALITERIDQALPLWQFNDASAWQRAGIAIAQMHQAGVWHADLNVNNIQFDGQGNVWLIDFDRAKLQVHSRVRLQGNLQRLERSVLKVCPTLHTSVWPALLRGYDQTV